MIEICFYRYFFVFCHISKSFFNFLKILNENDMNKFKLYKGLLFIFLFGILKLTFSDNAKIVPFSNQKLIND